MYQAQEKLEKKPIVAYKIIAAVILLIIVGYFAGIYLIEYRNINRTDAFGNTPLMEAVKLMDLSRTESLIKRGSDVNTTDNNGDTPLLIALKNNDNRITDLLFNNGAELNVEDKDGNTPLMLAIKSDNIEAIHKFIESGTEINVINKLGEHPLTVALQKENRELISLLIEKGSDIVVKPLSQMPVGSIVKDISTIWRFRGGENYSGRSTKDAHLEWILIAQEHFGKNKSLLLTREIVAKYEFNSTYGLLGGRDSWHNSKVREWMINTFYRRLSSGFRDAVEPSLTKTGGFIIPDETVFLLSQVELNLGNENIQGDHGEVINYFKIPGTRIANFTDHSWYYWTRSAELNVEKDRTGNFYKPRYRVRFVAPGGEVASEYPLMDNGGVRPAVNLNSETMVTSYNVDGTHVIVWGNSSLIKPYLNQ